MSDEKREYSVVSAVTIGTDEYRDLIEGLCIAKQDLSNYRSKFWDEQSKVDNLTKKVKNLESIIQNFKEFLSERPSVKEEYELFKIRSSDKDE